MIDAVPRPKPPADGIKATYPGFIEPALAMAEFGLLCFALAVLTSLRNVTLSPCLET